MTSSKAIIATLACALAALAAAAPGSAQIAVGVSDDLPIGAADGGASFYAAMQDAGMRENRIAVKWDPSAPGAIGNEAGIERAVGEAQAKGVNVVLSLYPLRPTAITGSPAAAGQFAAWAASVARRYPGVRDFIVGNEPNVNSFWQPQYGPNRKAISCATYTGLLAATYDALKGVNPGIGVIGVGLSPRGNDNPTARSNPSTSPVRCIRDMGAAYKASKRTRPLMDELSFHPFPNLATDPLGRGYQWPNAGLANLDRIKQAVWDAFFGTGPARLPGVVVRPLRLAGVDRRSRLAALPAERGGLAGRDRARAREARTSAVRTSPRPTRPRRPRSTRRRSRSSRATRPFARCSSST